MRPIAILRPEPGAGATLKRAQELGLPAFALSLFRIEPLDWTAPDPSGFDALLLTSANAVRYAGPQLQALGALPVHAVGPATAAAARDAGLTVSSEGTAGVDDLLSSLPADTQLLHLCGEDRRSPQKARGRVTAIAVYRSAVIADPPGIGRLKGAVALVHSPRAGRRLAELVATRDDTAVAAISTAAAEACGVGWACMSVARHPRDDALLFLGASLCEQLARK